jgi:hypothetical protein
MSGEGQLPIVLRRDGIIFGGVKIWNGVAWLGIGTMLGSGVLRGEEDWRIEMLNAHGFSGKTSELETLAGRYSEAEKGLDEELGRLGADDFQTRERAQATILMAGVAALSWMAKLPPQDDPEIKARLTAIRTQLRFRGAGSKIELLGYAVQSLLEERKNGKKAGESLVFAEWFERRQNPLREEYGRMEFHKDRGMTGKVGNGVLRLHGRHDGDGDQYLLLTAKECCEMDVFPEKFRVSCRLGGNSDEGSGGWHLGVSVGQIRVLFHPGMKGGGFRIETTDKRKVVRQNTPMGFDPSTKGFQRMTIGVWKLATGDVQLKVTVMNTDQKDVFADKVVVKGALIGELDRVGLWRSGRRGADALFDDFVLDLRGQ